MLLNFRSNSFLITGCLYVENGLDHMKAFLSCHILNTKTFELTVYFIPHISANMRVMLIKLSESVFLLMVHLCNLNGKNRVKIFRFLCKWKSFSSRYCMTYDSKKIINLQKSKIYKISAVQIKFAFPQNFGNFWDAKIRFLIRWENWYGLVWQIRQKIFDLNH